MDNYPDDGFDYDAYFNEPDDDNDYASNREDLTDYDDYADYERSILKDEDRFLAWLYKD